jgi:hypothetical protein
VTEELLRALETRVDAVVRECRALRTANVSLLEASERRHVAAVESRQRTGETLRDLRSVLGSAVRILRETRGA